jgi:hypothetical protein
METKKQIMEKKEKYTDNDLAIAFTCGKIYEKSLFPSVGQLEVIHYLNSISEKECNEGGNNDQ